MTKQKIPKSLTELRDLAVSTGGIAEEQIAIDNHPSSIQSEVDKSLKAPHFWRLCKLPFSLSPDNVSFPLPN